MGSALASTSSDLDRGRPHARLALLRSELALLRGRTDGAQTPAARRHGCVRRFG
ncbi:MAG: hypothetical protein IPO19_03055 [Rhodoferax sp.]|nr:hypothetical protein [Rhodoferax sp.]